MNAAAAAAPALDLRPRICSTASLKQLHWLPIEYHVIYNRCPLA
jgi:hypothetical protein